MHSIIPKQYEFHIERKCFRIHSDIKPYNIGLIIAETTLLVKLLLVTNHGKMIHNVTLSSPQKWPL